MTVLYPATGRVDPLAEEGAEVGEGGVLSHEGAGVGAQTRPESPLAELLPKQVQNVGALVVDDDAVSATVPDTRPSPRSTRMGAS